ncbi:hypothetical protein WR25_01688 [Diploscapter pachys]|uniref:Conserved oligomeric Golgi complex subunit 8 n=1 Tax=Diploscapter pachys TaxID=2018661 RepID=A0A2A2JSS2_9BILA|nr:hypothetical protein WR25_01688 [Diploscapter pachys]
MELVSHIEIEEEIKSMSLEQLRRERALISNELKSLQDQIGDLAFNNYRTYADAGRTTQDCTKIFTDMSEKLRTVSAEVTGLSSGLKSFHSKGQSVSGELDTVHSALDANHSLWEILSLPAKMDVCIRAGYYEAAYSLTNYGMMLQQHAIIKNPLIKKIADRLVEARCFLLDELFNKFSGPLDLADSIKVVNNVRKMPYLTATQLRLSVLQHRDIYLDKQILDISNHPELAIKAIHIYRESMYDTLVLYLAVFPENELVRKDPLVDPRWENWPTSSPSSILGQWASRNITRLIDIIQRADMKNAVDMCAVWSNLMLLGAAFGRMGLDCRPLIVARLTRMVLQRFQASVKHATNRMVHEVRCLTIASGEINPVPGLHDSSNEHQEGRPAVPPTPAPELSMWDDICVYANDILNALNDLRYTLTPVLLEAVCSCVRQSLRSVISWLSSQSSSAHFARAVRILFLHLAPFLSNVTRFLFPFSVISQAYNTQISKQQYDAFTEFNSKELLSSSEGSEKIEPILETFLHKKRIEDIDLDAVLRKDKPEEIKIEESAEPTVEQVKFTLDEDENAGDGQKAEEPKVEEQKIEEQKMEMMKMEEEEEKQAQQTGQKTDETETSKFVTAEDRTEKIGNADAERSEDEEGEQAENGWSDNWDEPDSEQEKIVEKMVKKD